MRKTVLLFCFLFNLFLNQPAIAQNDSACHLRISILTCSPGNELYSLFGHSAVRITDSVAHTDVIYNWGTFDFDEPDFYTKFMRGKLLYFVSPDRLNEFLYVYEYEGRSVTEQVLKLTCGEKLKIKKAVDINMTGDNRFYKYDFLFDNCTTRIRDLLEKNIASFKVNTSIVDTGTTFRNMLYSYLDNGGQPWSKLGIDILLGSKIDKPVTNDQAMFLPEYLMKAIDFATDGNKTIVDSKRLLISQSDSTDKPGKYGPLFLIGFISLILLLLSLSNAGWAKMMTRISDNFLLYITGLIGILLFFMWFFTDHTACADNYNILWAMPLNFFVAFIFRKNADWTKKYFMANATICALTLLIWLWLPQQLNIALIPFVVLLTVRYYKLSRT